MRVRPIIASSAVAFGLALLAPPDLLAHCDSLDGPVVKAAQAALDTKDVTHVLIWVAAHDEPEIRAVFEKTLTVRDLSPQAKELADLYFFETVVRVHRAGEGAAFTGLKPAGRDLGPAIPAADKAVDEGSIEPVRKLLSEAMQEHLFEHFNEVIAAREFKAGDLAGGRKYVETYVEFIHYVERVYEASIARPHGHFSETEPAAHGH